jgi:hypothetical protein
MIHHTSDTTVKKGSMLLLFAYAQGDKLNYQWFKDGEKILGATSNIFLIQSAASPDAGIYMCKVSGTCGSDSTQPIKVSIDTVIVKVDYTPEKDVNHYIVGDLLTIILPFGLETSPQIVNIFNSLGQRLNSNLYNIEFHNGKMIVDLASVPVGVYYFELNTGRINIRFPIIIIR